MTTAKINAAKAAFEYVENGMCIGLGSGSTVREFIKLLGEKVRGKELGVCCVTTSLESRALAIEEKIWVTEPDAIEKIDLAVDGADKVTKKALLKGGGGALTREKIIDYNAKKFIVIVDEGKVMEEPIEGKVSLEVLQFAVPFVMKRLKDFEPKIRMAKMKLGPVVSDNGSLILDCRMKLENPEKTERELDAIPGVIENGIFTKFDEIIVGSEKGSRRLIEK